MSYCKNCTHMVFDHVYFTNAQTGEIIGMCCTGTDSKNQGHTMEANAENGRLVLRPTCQCREINKTRKKRQHGPRASDDELDSVQTTLD